MKVALALTVSVLFHGILIFAAWLFFDSEQRQVVRADIDLANIEFSIAEQDDAEAKANSMMPTEPQRPSRPRDSSPRFDEARREALPPDVTAPKMPEPKPEEGQLEEFVPQVASVQANAPRQARVDAPPKPKKAIRPYYPTGSRQRGEHGEVVLEISVGADGSVEDVRIVESCGHRELDDAAVDAARVAQFSPAKSEGRNVSSVARLKLAFKLK